MRPSTAKQKGRETETLFVEWLRRNGAPFAERRRLAGVDDRGDIAGVPGVCVEVKSGARLDVAGWMRELAVEMLNDEADMGAVVVRPKGRPSPDLWWAIVPLELWGELMRDAGWLGVDDAVES